MYLVSTHDVHSMTLMTPLPSSASPLSPELMSNVDLTVMPGDRVGLVGQNGSGKSTLLQCIAGFRPMDEGKCVVKNGARMGEIAEASGCCCCCGKGED